MDMPLPIEARFEEFEEVTLVNGTEVPAGFVNVNGHLVPFWWTREGLIIKWSVFFGLLVLFTLYVVIGYYHAKRRIRKNLAPLGYHRWLIPRPELARVDPRYAYPQPMGYQTYRPQHYGMQTNMPPPPPMYDPSGRPPMYDMPQGGSKTAPSQQFAPGRDEEYGAPAGPPPTRQP